MEYTGSQLLIDLYECQTGALNDAAAMERILREGIRRARFDVVAQVAHPFPQHGLTLALILAQSHVVVHTWPEDRFVTVDLYACGDSNISPALQTLQDYLVECLEPKSVDSQLIHRGRAIADQGVG